MSRHDERQAFTTLADTLLMDLYQAGIGKVVGARKVICEDSPFSYNLTIRTGFFEKGRAYALCQVAGNLQLFASTVPLNQEPPEALVALLDKSKPGKQSSSIWTKRDDLLAYVAEKGIAYFSSDSSGFRAYDSIDLQTFMGHFYAGGMDLGTLRQGKKRTGGSEREE